MDTQHPWKFKWQALLRVYRSQQFVHERITDARAGGRSTIPLPRQSEGTRTFRLNEPVGKEDSERVHPRSAYARQYGLNARLPTKPPTNCTKRPETLDAIIWRLRRNNYEAATPRNQETANLFARAHLSSLCHR